MNDQRPFLAFITRAHRRRIAWRFIEHGAIGLLIASGIAAIVLAVAWWRGIDALAASIAVMVIGVIAGFVASIWRTPSLIETAGLVESQIGSPELLSSALLSGRADFADALRAMADERVRGATLASLVLRRFGLRTFGGAALASALVMVVAILSSGPMVERAAIASNEGGSNDPRERWIENSIARDLATRAKINDATRPPQRDVDSSGSKIESDPVRANADFGNRSENNSTIASRGGGAARSDGANADRIQPNENNTIASQSGTLTMANGVGTSIKASVPGANATEQVSDSSNPQSIAPWRSSAWPRDREAALQAVQNGSVPDTYRSLVQDYFRRD